MITRVVLFVALTCSGSALAHQVGLSRGLYTQTSEGVDVELVFARNEAAQAVPGLDADGDGAITDPELAVARVSALVDEVRLEGCTGTFVGASLTEEDGLAVRARYACPMARVTVEFALASKLAAGHRHLAHATTLAGETDHVAFAGATSFTFGADAPPPSRLAFIGIGVEHILLGFDHLVFLFALVVVGGRLRSMLAIVTAFTVAHSITLALAVLEVVTPPGEIIEPLIALSIAYVGIENFFVKGVQGRWRITAPFGLIHGFGFAGALGEVGVPKDDVPLTLLLFNVGVELGQLAVLALALPLLYFVRARGWWSERATKIASAIVVVLGVFWLVERVLGGLGLIAG